MALSTLNQNIVREDKFGGSIKVFEGHCWILTGGFEFNLADLPDNGNVLPQGTPVNCDEETRKIQPSYTFAVSEKAEADATAYKIKKGISGTLVKKGMYVMVAPDTVATKGTAVEVTAVDFTNEAYDVITVGATLGALEVGAILVEADKSGADAVVKVIPNALLDRDVRKAPGAKQVNADGVFNSEAPVLERRIPPIPDAFKKALVEGGCYVRFSKRK